MGGGLRTGGVSGPVGRWRGIVTGCLHSVCDRFRVQARLGWSVLSSVLLGAGVIASAATGEGVASAAPPATPSAPSVTWGTHGPHNEVCEDAFEGRTKGSLTKTASAGPSGSLVLPGQTITVNLTWNPGDLEGHSFSSLDCVRIGSHISPSLSQIHTPAPSGGMDTFSYAMPNDTNGQAVCDRAVLLRADGGQGDGGQGDGRGDGGGDSESEQGAANELSGHGQQQHDDGGGSGAGRDQGSQGGDAGYVESSGVFCYSIDPPAVTPEVPIVILFPVAALIVAGGALLVHRHRQRPRPAT